MMEANIRLEQPNRKCGKSQTVTQAIKRSKANSHLKQRKQNEEACNYEDAGTYRPSFQAEILSSNASALKEKNPFQHQQFWGNVRPYWRDSSQTQTPRIIISSSFLQSLLANILIIAIVCILLPLVFSQIISNQTRAVEAPRMLSDFHRQLTSSILDGGQEASTLPSKEGWNMYGLYGYSGIWACFQLVFLMLLLFGNPGYGEFLAEGQGKRREGELGDSRKTLGKDKSRCSICRSMVDHTVMHCDTCNLCCEGFTHHCQWVGKCIGYRNILFLKAYFYGYVVGILLLIIVIMLESFRKT